MPKERLKAKLAELHGELERAHDVDPASRELLQQLADDIRALLDGGGSVEQEHHGVSERVGDAARTLETTHPLLAGVIRGVGDLLAQSGI